MSGGSSVLAQYVAGLLAEQETMSAAEAFSARHAELADGPARRFSMLLPAAPPGPGEQYAFEVDLDACSGCKACVAACHALNGLDEGESWRSVGLLHGGADDVPILQHVTHACHHCVEPACSIGCPVNAYDKDPATGIVKHLDDQCIGCQYCTLACPYEVPRYHAAKGIVRKCDMCSSRLKVGEAPACAQACPNGAIRIRTVKIERIRRDAEANVFLPGAAPPQHTLPTTMYRSARALPANLLPGDYHDVNPQHGHPALAAMLVLTQGAVGAFALRLALAVRTGEGPTKFSATLALALGLLGMGASVFHLGRPLYAFRALLNLKRSWLSREILAFGLFAGFAALHAAALFLGLPAPYALASGFAAAASGLAAVAFSAMIYVFVGRVQWSFASVFAKFFLTTAWLGALAAALASTTPAATAWLARAGLIAALAKLAIEAFAFLHLSDRRRTPERRTAQLLTGKLLGGTALRFGAGLLSLLCLQAAWADASAGSPATAALAIGLLAALIGETCERLLFFLAAVDFRMPGSIRA
jgi:Fe-S-cluster-containing dehydrogenase component/DMSO reductase anchor subunit